MNMKDIPFDVTDWAGIKPDQKTAQEGQVVWRTRVFGDIRVRMVEYSAGYVSDHWCRKGHILFCIEGELHTELEDGRSFILKAGMSYQVADNNEPHRSCSPRGARLFVVD